MGGLTDVIESSGLLKVVEKTAPLLATALGSPIAGMAIALLASAFGLTVPTPGQLASVISSDPDAKSKLVALENQHAEALASIAASNYQTEVSDRINARVTASLYRPFLRHMAYLVTFGFFGVLILFFSPWPIDSAGNDRELLSMLVGMLVSKWQTIIDFFYGSSSKQVTSNK